MSFKNREVLEGFWKSSLERIQPQRRGLETGVFRKLVVELVNRLQVLRGILDRGSDQVKIEYRKKFLVFRILSIVL